MSSPKPTDGPLRRRSPRRRSPFGPRAAVVACPPRLGLEVTETGEALFLGLRDAAVRFDAQLRQGLSPQDLARVERVLDRLVDNVGGSGDGPPWTGLVDAPGAVRGAGRRGRRGP